MIARLSLTRITFTAAFSALDDDPFGVISSAKLEIIQMPPQARNKPTPRPRLDQDGPKKPLPGALLYSRAETAALLRRSIASIVRMEHAGLIDVIKFGHGEHARAYHRADDVIALARRGVAK